MSEADVEQVLEGELHPETDAPGYESVAGSVVRSGLWSVFGQVAALAAALIATPFTIRLLGPARYGLLSLLQSVQNWIGLADFGMTTASTRFAGERNAQDDPVGEAAVNWTSVAITVSATLAASTAVGLAAPFIVKSVLHVHGSLVGPGEVAVRLAAATCVAGVLGGTLNTPLIVRLQWRKLTLIQTATTVAGTVFVPLALTTFGGGVITSAAIGLALSAISALAFLWVAIRLLPQMRVPRLSRSAAGKLLRYGGALTVSGIALIPLNTADRLLIAHYRSTTEIAYYVVAWRLATLLTVIPIAVCHPLFPGFIKLKDSGQITALLALYKQALQGLFLVMTPAMLLLAFIAKPFLSLWAGKIYGVHSTDLFYIMVVGVWFNALGWLPSYFLSLNHMRQFATIHVLEVIPYVVITALLASHFGATGTAFAWAGRITIEAIILFLLARHVGGVTVSPLSANRVRSVASPLVLGGLLLLLSQHTSSLQARVGYTIAITAIYAVGVWLLVLTQREREGLRGISPLTRFRRASA
jgi:O-antigen/teichoic acid export membrane protein